MKTVCYMDSPVGTLGVAEDGIGVSDIFFVDKNAPEIGAQGKTELLQTVCSQLREYFAQSRREFTFPLSLQGTPFQRRVWQALCKIPYGETRSYSEIARAIGSEKACRAVGMANHRNPVAIVVPCHRVVGAKGALVGYGGGLPVKEYLLLLERGNAVL